MKLIKYVSIVVLIGALIGCGHGYEGEYQASNEIMNAFVGAEGGQKLVLGSNYIESQGQRTKFDKIFVRKSGGEKYLVFKDKESEEVWEIVNEDTLLQGYGFMSVNLVRIK